MRWFFALLVLLAPLAAIASDRSNMPPPEQRHFSSQGHDGFSPFPPPPVDDTLFIVDTDTDLDTGCAFRSDGPLVIRLQVTRYVGPVTADGTLVEDSRLKLIAGGFLSRNAHLRLPAYDVDIHGDPADPAVPPEVDRVMFNGREVGILTGDDEIWKLNEFVIPIEWVRFPSKGSDGTPPVPADNIITIDIDTEGGGEENWCTAVDWVELDFGAIAPIFLVHGIFSSGKDAWPNFAAVFADAGIPFSDEIDLSPIGSIEGNAASLAGRLRSQAAKFGAKRCHIIAHSKGGLDTRAYLNGEYDADELRVLSLYTLSTPHHGTVLADIGVALQTGLAIASGTRRLIPQLFPFISDLSTLSTAIFNFRYGSVPGGIRVYCYGADADANGDGSLNAGEAAQLPSVLSSPAVATALYNIVGNESPVKVTFGTQTVRLWGDFSFRIIDIDIVRDFRKNDVLVSTVSAEAPFGAYAGTRLANHVAVKDSGLARTVLNQILADYPSR
ncbi:MAG TPA: hypothetical protein VEK57_15600 [Thermoanaerobaculia bacterium]|nr:hypothetical protein [Thermoanaerobaculia bacterium]